MGPRVHRVFHRRRRTRPRLNTPRFTSAHRHSDAMLVSRAIPSRRAWSESPPATGNRIRAFSSGLSQSPRQARGPLVGHPNPPAQSPPNSAFNPSWGVPTRVQARPGRARRSHPGRRAVIAHPPASRGLDHPSRRRQRAAPPPPPHPGAARAARRTRAHALGGLGSRVSFPSSET